MPASPQHRYQSIRFEPEEGDRAYICTDPSAEDFRPDLTAAILNESHTGCGLELCSTDSLQEGESCLTRVGRLSPLRATVVWRRLDGERSALRVGLKYDK